MVPRRWQPGHGHPDYHGLNVSTVAGSRCRLALKCRGFCEVVVESARPIPIARGISRYTEDSQERPKSKIKIAHASIASPSSRRLRSTLFIPTICFSLGNNAPSATSGRNPIARSHEKIACARHSNSPPIPSNPLCCFVTCFIVRPVWVPFSLPVRLR